MAQHYFNQKDIGNYRLPDMETFYVSRRTPTDCCPACVEYLNGGQTDPDVEPSSNHDRSHTGWYWQACLPGCLPDGEAGGPFETEKEALADAREGMED